MNTPPKEIFDKKNANAFFRIGVKGIYPLAGFGAAPHKKKKKRKK